MKKWYFLIFLEIGTFFNTSSLAEIQKNDSLKDVKWILGDIAIPVLIAIIGYTCYRAFIVKKSKKSSSRIKGNNNTVIQNSNIKKTDKYE